MKRIISRAKELAQRDADSESEAHTAALFAACALRWRLRFSYEKAAPRSGLAGSDQYGARASEGQGEGGCGREGGCQRRGPGDR